MLTVPTAIISYVDIIYCFLYYFSPTLQLSNSPILQSSHSHSPILPLKLLPLESINHAASLFNIIYRVSESGFWSWPLNYKKSSYKMSGAICDKNLNIEALSHLIHTHFHTLFFSG